MKHYVVNRKCRWDRLLLWQGAMAAQRVPEADLLVRVAMDKDDYADREDLCMAAMDDGFGEFFGYHLEHWCDYIGFGHLICSWSIMRVWREIAQGDKTAVQWLDDYALGIPSRKFSRWVADLNPNIVQLCWHYRDDLFENPHRLPSKLYPLSSETKVGRRDVVVGAEGASDWALVLSPQGAQWLLDYMASKPYFNTELAVVAMWAENSHRKSVYSVVSQDPTINGTVPLTGNDWVVGLSQFTETASDLTGLHEGT